MRLPGGGRVDLLVLEAAIADQVEKLIQHRSELFGLLPSHPFL